ncbi:Crp/Fnr family transcriptional regulator [Sandaracinobacter neustonicus]|uniref:Crp/Fnr family transcriptional regulator n=1 Tax=Sandaracinobacter neustonicus TaxID=1715348 RepID=A0A501XE21_9SPHN|nr:Crp/Fnr family transcriptional regulator [Sandaracinobacter neustonicus]TPE58792.1 Crp/Fnr family transcriptional regulator [Sandaracinobacter neustonicus]
MLLTRGWLSTATPDFQQALLEAAIFRAASPGAEFMHAGDERGGLVAIALGTAELAFRQGHPDTRAVHLCHAGFWAGYKTLLGIPRFISLKARTDVLWALVPQHAAERLLAENPIWWRNIALMADDLANIGYMATADLTLQDSEARAVAVMLRLAGCRHMDPPDISVLELRMSQNDLAAMATMSRNTFNGIISRLVEEGYIALGYRCIRLLRPDILRAIASQDE